MATRLAGPRRPGIDLVRPGGDGLDDLLLERLVGEDLETLGKIVLLPHERLVLGDDVADLGLDARQVVVMESGTARQLEVVVEAVLDGRADREVGPGHSSEHRLGQHVRGRVAQDLPARRRAGGDDRDAGAIGELGREVDGAPVHGGRDGILGQPAADGLGELADRGPASQLLGGAVREPNLNLVHHQSTRLVAAEPALDQVEPRAWDASVPPEPGIGPGTRR